MSFAAISPVKNTGLPSQTEINNDVSAMEDAKVQQEYQKREQEIRENSSHSDDTSNCPNCPH